jgi:Glutamine amidotransferase class-I
MPMWWVGPTNSALKLPRPVCARHTGLESTAHLGSGKGLTFSGLSPDGRLVEIIELGGHPFFMAGQFHPELRSRPTRPHPLFRDFVGAAKTLAAAGSERAVVLPG